MYTIKSILTLFCLFIFAASASAQALNENDSFTFPKNQKEYEELYQRNIKKSRINGVYIPMDLEDAFKELDALSPENAKLKFKNAPEEVIARKLHFGLGRWISVNWNFREGSRYVEHLRNLGLKDPDHMIQFTIVSYHRYKNGLPLNVESQVAEFQKDIDERLKKMNERKEVIHTETRKIKKN